MASVHCLLVCCITDKHRVSEARDIQTSRFGERWLICRCLPGAARLNEGTVLPVPFVLLDRRAHLGRSSPRAGRALESKPNCANTFQAFSDILPLVVQLAKTSHMGNPQVKMQRSPLCPWRWGVRAGTHSLIPEQGLVLMCDLQGVARFWLPAGANLLDCPDPGFQFEFQALKNGYLLSIYEGQRR